MRSRINHALNGAIERRPAMKNDSIRRKEWEKGLGRQEADDRNEPERSDQSVSRIGGRRRMAGRETSHAYLSYEPPESSWLPNRAFLHDPHPGSPTVARGVSRRRPHAATRSWVGTATSTPKSGRRSDASQAHQPEGSLAKGIGGTLGGKLPVVGDTSNTLSRVVRHG